MKRLMNLGIVTLMLAIVGCAGKMQQAPARSPAPPRSPVADKPTPSPTQSPTATINFGPVFFDFDSFTLRADGRAVLDQSARTLRDNADLHIIIEGHCDARGTVEYNLALGERRAKTARDYLVAAGISSSRIRTVSYGKERPFASGHDERAWAQNRRAHVVLAEELSTR